MPRQTRTHTRNSSATWLAQPSTIAAVRRTSTNSCSVSLGRPPLSVSGHAPANAKRALAVRIGRRVRIVRLDAGMTQQQVARSRYTKAYVSAIENALVLPSLAALDFIAMQLGTSSSFLLGDEVATGHSSPDASEA